MAGDALEREIRSSLSREVDSTLPALDARMRASTRGSARPARRGLPGALRPGLALAAVVLALGLGYWWGQRQADVGGPRVAAEYAIAPIRADAALRAELGPAFERTAVPANDRAGSGETPPAVPPEGGQGREAGPSSAPAFSQQAETRDAAQPESSVVVDGRRYAIPAGIEPASVGVRGEALILPAADMVLSVLPSGEWTVLARDLRRPAGVAVAETGDVFVTERVADGRLLRLGPAGGLDPVKVGLVYPAGIAFDAEGALYLAEQGRGRVVRLAPQDGRITTESSVETIASGLGATSLDPSEPMGPYALAFDAEGALWVRDRHADGAALFRITRPPWWQRLW